MLYFILFFSITIGIILFSDWLYSNIYIYRKKFVKKVSYKELIYETMYYTENILYQNKIKQFPIIDIRYYGTKKWSGKMVEGRIVIYLKSNISITDIVDTVLHEISHYISMTTRSEEYTNYNKLLKELGYDNHPEEIKSRKFVRLHLKPCIDYLIKKGIIE